MTWAYVNSGTATFATGGSVAVPYPATVTAGNLLLIGVGNRASVARYHTAPTGFTKLYADSEHRHAVFARLADGTETGSVTVTPSVAADNNFGQMAQFSGAPSTLTGILHVSNNNYTGDLTDAHRITPSTAITVTESDTLVFNVAVKTNGSNTQFVPPSGWTKIDGIRNVGGSTSLCTWSYQIQTTATNLAANQDYDLGTGGLAASNATTVVLIPGEEVIDEPTVETDPLYYGASLLANKTAIQYSITAGHTDIGGSLLAKGTDGTTNGTGNFILPGNPALGNATDPVTLHLYWEEGNPAVDRSLIVKTTLVAAA